MADISALEAALVNADKAGDAASAKVLAAEIMRLRDPGIAPEKPSGVVRLGRGMMDLYQGVKQLGLMAKDAFTGRDEASAYTKRVGEEIAAYERGRKAGGDTGFDWSRLAGNILTPTTLIPGGAGVGLGGRVATGALSGAATGGLMFTPEGGSKAGQVVLGALGGAAAPVAVEGIARGVRGAVNAVGGGIQSAVRSGVDEATVTQTMRQVAQDSGIDLGAMTQQAQDNLRTQVRAHLGGGAGGDPETIARVARATALDPRLQLTRGQVSRSPIDWQTEQNLRGVQGVGDDLRARFGQQGQILGESGERIRAGMGGSTDRPFQAAEQAIGAVRQKFSETGDEVSALYRAARETVGAQADVPLGPLQRRAIQTLNEFEDVIPGPIKTRLESLGVGRVGATNPTRAFTVEEAEALDKLINKRWDASNRPLTAALTDLKGAIRDSLNAVGDDAGTEAAQAFRSAKTAAAGRFDEFGQRIARAATEDVAPDKFVRRFVVNGDVRDVRGLVNTLTTGSPEQITRGRQALNSIRAATLTQMFEGTGKTGGAISEGTLSGAKLDAAMREIGLDKLRALFTPAQIRDLELLRRVSLDLTKPPALSDINYSRTSSALANLLSSIGKVPGLGMARGAAQAETARVQSRVAQEALSGGVAPTTQELISGAQSNALARRVAPFAVPPTNALTYQLGQ